MDTASLPGMVVASADAEGSALHVNRAAPNVWWAAFADDGVEPAALVDSAQALPSALLSFVGAPATLAKIELDVCGTWVTLANNERARPVVVRRAGWVDVRGHPLDGPLLDDRVGLGPGDCLVLLRDQDAADDALLDALLRSPCDPGALRTAAIGSGATRSVVLGVPSDLGADARQRVADATGVSLEDVDLPGYPLGDLQPELWAEPPRPPRLARLRLQPDRRSVREVRDLLDRLLASWRLAALVDEAAVKLAASELASNAVMHSQAPESVTLRYLGDAVRIEVDDRSADAPVVREADDELVGGRGLHVVEAVSSKWGVEPKHAGKSVWFEVEVRAPL